MAVVSPETLSQQLPRVTSPNFAWAEPANSTPHGAVASMRQCMALRARMAVNTSAKGSASAAGSFSGRSDRFLGLSATDGPRCRTYMMVLHRRSRHDSRRRGTPMKLLVLGATGQVGSALVTQSLERGFEVAALVRSPGKVRDRHPRLEVVEGNPLDEAALTPVVSGRDAVLSVLGHTDLEESHLVTDGARALTEVMRRTGVRRAILVSSTLVAPGGSFLTKIPRYLTRHALSDSLAMEKVVQATNLDWTLLRLVRLTNGAPSPYRTFDDEPPTVTASVSRATVAGCMLDVLADTRCFRRTIGVRAT